MAKIRENLKAAQSRQKSYADTCRRELNFEEGDYVYLKVSPIRGTQRFQVRGKLAPRYIGPYKILKKVGAVAYRLELPEEMSGIHNVFHISQLKKCLRVPEEQVSMEVMDLKPDLQYQERPIKILDVATRQTRRTAVRFCRVQWRNHTKAEATWEREDDLKKEFPTYSRTSRNLEVEILLRGVGFVTPYFQIPSKNREVKFFEIFKI